MKGDEFHHLIQCQDLSCCETSCSSSKSPVQPMTVSSLSELQPPQSFLQSPPRLIGKESECLILLLIKWFFSADFNPASIIFSNIDFLLYLPSSITKMQFGSFVIVNMKRNTGFWPYPHIQDFIIVCLVFPF